MTSMNVSLPESMKQFVEEQVEKRAFSTPSEYVRALIREAQVSAQQEELERLLLEGVDSPVGEMTSDDWASIRREVFARIAARNKA